MARILILIGSHLWSAPRPQKEAAALATAGHEVTVAGGWFDATMAEWDQRLAAGAPYRFVAVGDLRPGNTGRKLRRLAKSLRRRVALKTLNKANLFLPDLLGLFTREGLRHALRARADLTIAHHEGGLWIARQLQRNGLRVGLDMEDWFSEDLLPADRAHRPLTALKELEGHLLRTCHYALTTSQALANDLARAYGVPTPAVIYNTFADAPGDGRAIDRPTPDPPTLHWFSQTIGPGRGLETLFAALPHLKNPCEIHLRGNLGPARSGWLETQVPTAWRERVKIHDLVPNAELASRIAEHDIGLALEEAYCPSRDATITNKLFQYLQAGLAVVATDTRGQREAAALLPNACRLAPQRVPVALAAAIDGWLADPAALARAKAEARRGFESHFSWSKQAAILTRKASEALAKAPGSPPTP
jgi:glycosyltransferase involved in cell wall biosynthesis